MKCVIAGSRGVSREDFERSMEQVPWASEITEVISGTAAGPDTFGEKWAEARGLRVTRMPADWNTYGKRAGYLRNEQMAMAADACVCVWDGSSKGTGHMVKLAMKHKLRLIVFTTKRRTP